MGTDLAPLHAGNTGFSGARIAGGTAARGLFWSAAGAVGEAHDLLTGSSSADRFGDTAAASAAGSGSVGAISGTGSGRTAGASAAGASKKAYIYIYIYIYIYVENVVLVCLGNIVFR